MRHLNISVTAVFAATLALAPPSGGGIVIETLVIEGDLVGGVGLVTTISNIAVNAAGGWLVEVDTDNPDTTIDGALLRDGALDWRHGDAVAAPRGASLSSFDSITLNDLGQSGYNFFLDGTQGTNDDSGVYGFLDPGSLPFDGTLLVAQESSEAPGLTPGTPFTGFLDVKINNAGQLWVVASVDDPNIASTTDRALYVLDPDREAGGIGMAVLVSAEGEILPGQVEAVADFGTGPHASAFNDAGDAIFFVDLAGDTTVDGAIYRFDYDALDRLLVAQEGSPSPLEGRNWVTLSSPELDLSNNGDVVYGGALDGDAATNLLLVRNGAKFRQEGDPVPGLGGFVLESFGTGPLEIADNGQVLWYGDWNDPDTTVDSGLFLEDVMLVQEGVTVLEGSVVDTIRGVEDGYHMSSDGTLVVFEAVLADGREGAFRIALAEPCPWDCGDGDGTVGINDLLALLAGWGGPGDCDFDGAGIGISDLLKLLAEWGPCG